MAAGRSSVSTLAVAEQVERAKMNDHVLKEMLAVVRREQERRMLLPENEDPQIASAEWWGTDMPLLNELCLMVFVTLWHQVERELVGFAAQAGDSDNTISFEQHQENVEQLRKGRGWNWEEINKRLRLKDLERYKEVQALRHLSNSYKHDHLMKPGKELLNLLRSKGKVNYAPLPESDSLRRELADFVGIREGADFCDLAERFVDIASEFLADVKRQGKLSKIAWRRAPMNPDDWER